MSAGVHIPVPNRHAAGQSRIAVRFFLRALVIVSLAGLLCALLAAVFGRPGGTGGFWFPPAFGVTTALLAFGSYAVHRAVTCVRREQQPPFRAWLTISQVAGTLFMGVQAYGLWTLLPARRESAEASLGVTPFVLMLAGMHALHLTIAVLFLAFVATRARFHRYDHEYNWGVRFCAYFWHALGVAWLFVLAIFAIAL